MKAEVEVSIVLKATNMVVNGPQSRDIILVHAYKGVWYASISILIRIV